MAEEIMNYKAPICVIPPQSLIKSEIHMLRRKMRRCRKPESLQECERLIKDAERGLADHYASKG